MGSDEAWNDAKRDVTALGEQLRQHFEATRGGDEARRAHLQAAVEDLGRAVTEVFDSLGKVLDDPDVRAGSTRAAQSFSQAVAATFAEVGSGLQQALRRSPSQSSQPPPGPSASPPPPGPSASPPPPSTPSSAEEGPTQT
jgi:hypothetical protein